MFDELVNPLFLLVVILDVLMVVSSLLPWQLQCQVITQETSGSVSLPLVGQSDRSRPFPRSDPIVV